MACPIFERFFLGDEFSIRGYNVRSISPLAPLDTFITSQNVVIASNPHRDPGAGAGRAGQPCQHWCFYRADGLKRSAAAADRILLLAAIHSCWAISNIAFRSSATQSDWRPLPILAQRSIFAPRTISSFPATSLMTSRFCSTVGADPLRPAPEGLSRVSLSTLAACNTNTDLALILDRRRLPGLVMRDNRLVTTAELDNAQ